ncbi:MAG: aspartate aminotransferase family protein [Candidatus Hadarchaeaceae archaeon]
MVGIKLEKSRKLSEKSKKIQAGGTGSTQRLKVITIDDTTIYLERGKGSKIYDVDGNEYIDYYLDYGPLINGHAHPAIVKAIKEQLEKGTMYGINNELEIALCEKIIKHVPCAEMVGFHSSGSEAVHTTIRLARAYTGKIKIIKFEGHYHGWFDDVNISAFSPPKGPEESPEPVLGAPLCQPKNVIDNIIVLPWNNEEVLEKTLKKHGNEVAGVIMEPIELGHGILPKEGYMNAVRELTEKYNVLLIFDEVKTLFRVGLSGAQGYLKVKPDLFVCSKAMGGGIPISAYGGKREVVELISRGKVPAMGTYNANPLSLAGAIANIEVLEKDGGRAYKHMYSIGEKLMKGIREIFGELNVKAIVKGLPCQFVTCFTEMSADEINNYRDWSKAIGSAQEKGEKFRIELLRRGVFCSYPDWHLSTVHSDSDAEKTLKAIEESLKIID